MGEIIIKVPGDVKEVFEITDESKIKALFGFLKNENMKLKKLIDSITPENLHKEIDWGGVSGEEEW